MVNQRIEFYHEGNIEKIKDLVLALGSHAEAVRVNTGIVTETRNGNTAIQTHVSEMKAKLDVLPGKMDGVHTTVGDMKGKLESLAGKMDGVLARRRR
ncbi:hypothetical protein ACVWW6_000389 [Bradyrhizobium sp. USDA 3311]